MYTLEKMYKIAIELANNHHLGQKDKNGEPYICHVMRVSCDNFLKSNIKARIVAALHDIIEDTKLTMFDLNQMNFFDDEILNAVYILTKQENQTYEEYIDKILENELAILVKYCDLNDNLNTLRQPENKDEKYLERYTKYCIAKSKLLGTKIISEKEQENLKYYKDIFENVKKNFLDKV